MYVCDLTQGCQLDWNDPVWVRVWFGLRFVMVVVVCLIIFVSPEGKTSMACE